MSLISVIIPTFNRKEVLPRAINSVLKQKGVPLELIIVDDGSTEKQDTGWRRADDEKQNSLRPPLPAIRFLRLEENKGPAAARNVGIKEAKGEWIAFLDSDDEWKPGKLKAQLDFFEKNPDYEICQTEEIWVRNGVRVNPMKKHKKYAGWIFRECLPLCIVSPSAVMMRRKLFDAVGLFDEALPACEDYDLWLRIASRYPIGLIEKPCLIKYGGHADQRSREVPAMDRFRIQSLAKILREGILTPEQTLAARQMLAEKTRIYIAGALKRGKEKEAEEIKMLAQSTTVNAQR